MGILPKRSELICLVGYSGGQEQAIHGTDQTYSKGLLTPVGTVRSEPLQQTIYLRRVKATGLVAAEASV